MYKSSSDNYLCATHEDNSVTIFKLNEKDMTPCYKIKSSQKTDVERAKDDASLTSFWDYVTKKNQISIIDCLFLDDEFLLVIDSELVGHVHYFGKRTEEEKGKFRNYTINFDSNKTGSNQKPSKNYEFKDAVCLGGQGSDLWNLVILTTKKDYNLKTKEFFNQRTCLKVYSIGKRDEILEFKSEMDFADQEGDNSHAVLQNMLQKTSNEMVGFELSSSKLFRFKCSDEGQLDLVEVKEVKSQEDSLYLIISECKSAKKNSFIESETPKKRNSIFKGKVFMREKLNLD